MAPTPHQRLGVISTLHWDGHDFVDKRERVAVTEHTHEASAPAPLSKGEAIKALVRMIADELHAAMHGEKTCRWLSPYDMCVLAKAAERAAPVAVAEVGSRVARMLREAADREGGTLTQAIVDECADRVVGWTSR